MIKNETIKKEMDVVILTVQNRELVPRLKHIQKYIEFLESKCEAKNLNTESMLDVTVRKG